MATKKGDAAREAVKNKIIEAFGENYVGTQDKKIYVNMKDGPSGEVLQLAISMTIPKTPIGGGIASATPDGGAFQVAPAESTVLSEQDEKAVDDLMRKLGI